MAARLCKFVMNRRSAVLAFTLLACGAAACSQSAQAPLPDLATASPSKQQLPTPQDQKRAIDEMVAKRNAQAAEAARQSGESGAK